MADSPSVTSSAVNIIKASEEVVAVIEKLCSGGQQLHQVGDLLTELNLFALTVGRVRDCEPTSPAKLQELENDLRICETYMKAVRLELSKGFDELSWLSRNTKALERHRATFVNTLNDIQLSRTKSMETQLSQIEKNLQMTFHDLQEVSNNTKFTRERNDRAQEGHRTKLLDWLYIENFEETHAEIRQRRQPNTGQWLFEVPEYVKWRSSGCGIFWGYGIPGAGKTFISSTVIDNLLEPAAEKRGVAYIYFRREEQDQQWPVDVVSSLVKQLTCQLPEIPMEIEELYEGLKSQLGRPPLGRLHNILISLTKYFTQTFIICDALDECPPELRRKHFLPFFQRMSAAGTSIFLTSREYPEDIQDSLYASAINIRLSAQMEDITYYVEQKIHENPRAKRLITQGKCKNKIVSCLTESSKGMFLLVHLYFNNLCKQVSSKQMLAELERIQNNTSRDTPLDPTYDKCMEILQSQSRSCVDLALKILLWLAHSRRTLTVNEMQMAVSIEFEQPEFEFEDMELPDRKTLLDVCAGLVTIDESNDTFLLAHPTLQEYLLRKSIIPKDADFQIAMACTTFLSFTEFSEGACDSDDSLHARHSLYPFLEYAAKYLAFHLKNCDEGSSTKLLLTFLQNPGNVASYLQAVHASSNDPSQRFRTPDSGIFDEDGYNVYPKGQTALHVAAALGHSSLVRQLLEADKVDIGALDDRGRTAIHIASSEGHESVVMLLLKEGADPFIADNDGVTALKWAESKGLKFAVELMLQKRADLIGATATSKDQKQVAVRDTITPRPAKLESLKLKANRFKLETTIYEDHVSHITYEANLEAGQRRLAVEQRWKRKREIGVGGFGTVWLEEEAGGKLRAVKQLFLRARNADYWSEVNTLAKLTDLQGLTDYSRLFVQFSGWYEDSEFIYIAMEYLEYGDLSKYIKDGSARLKVKVITKQILEGIMAMHERQICHRDLKPQNILVASIDPIWVKISDFGVSKRDKDSNLFTVLGTNGYLAPEIIGLLGSGKAYTNAVDIWALGCIIHQILTSEIPFAEKATYEEGDSELFSQINDTSQAPQADFKLLMGYCDGDNFPTGPLRNSGASDDAIDFVKRLLAVQPSSRMTAKEALEHRWIKGT